MDSGIDVASWEPEYTSDPYPFYAKARQDSPAVRVVLEGRPGWLITRYTDVLEALTDPRFSNDTPPVRLTGVVASDQPASAAMALARHMLRTDPPEHTRLRRLVSKAFTPRRIGALRPRVRQIADELLAAVLPRGRADLIAEFAQPLPLKVIGELLGVPAADMSDFVRWVHTYINTDDRDPAAARQALGSLATYLTALIERRGAAQPSDVEGGSLLDGLIAVRDAGEGLEQHELVAMAFLLLGAGFETTMQLIGNGALALLRNPDQLAALRADPGLIGAAIDEFLRYDGPVKMAPAVRYTTADVRIGGVLIPAGEAVFLSLGDADRDPVRFADPDRLDIRRLEGGHLAFGHGVHYCLGAPLARLEAEVAFTALLAACPDLALAADPTELAWARSVIIRGLKRLPVTFTAASPRRSLG